MLQVFGHYVRWTVLLLGIAEFLLIATGFYAFTMMFTDVANPAMIDGRQFSLAIAPAILVFVLMFALGLYEPIARFNLRVLLQRLSAVCLLAVVGLYGLYAWWGGFPAPVMRAATAAGLAFMSVLAIRSIYGGVSDIDAFRRRVMIVGSGLRAQEVTRLCRAPHSNLRLMAHVAAEPDALADPAMREGVPMEEMLPAAQELGVSEIVVALDERRGVMPNSELLACRMRGMAVIDDTTFVERETGKVDLDNVYPSWIVFSDGFRATPAVLAAKRFVDLCASVLLLTMTAPVMVLAAIAVRIDSPGTVFYRQVRVGYEGRPFSIMKFRSMRSDAERDGAARWATENDPRITRVGAVLRRSRIDELPQLFNVLRGEMSFVGPRPERPEFVRELSATIRYYNDRHRVKPGVTGWAQINYPYGASVEDAKEKLKYDLYYMKNCSLFLDFIIILKTIRVVLWPHGVR